MNDSEIWHSMMIINEIRSRLSMALYDGNVKGFIKDFVMRHKNDPAYLHRFAAYIRENQPKYVDCLNKILILL